jgi:hypothetical protein
VSDVIVLALSKPRKPTATSRNYTYDPSTKKRVKLFLDPLPSVLDIVQKALGPILLFEGRQWDAMELPLLDYPHWRLCRIDFNKIK